MEMNNLDSRIRLLSEMEKEYEGFNKAVRTVMQASERKALRGVRGPVANLMKVGKKYAVAIEIALGAGLQNIVVEREEDAKSAIQLLKQRDGRTRDVPGRSRRSAARRCAMRACRTSTATSALRASWWNTTANTTAFSRICSAARS